MLEIIASRGSKRWAGIQIIITKTKTKQRKKDKGMASDHT